MAYQTTHPVEVGTFGRFRFGGKLLVETWKALEELAYECDWWIGIYSAHNLLDYGRHRRLLTADEIAMFERAL